MRFGPAVLVFCVAATAGCASVSVSRDHRRESDANSGVVTDVTNGHGGTPNTVVASTQTPIKGDSVASRGGSANEPSSRGGAGETLVGLTGERAVVDEAATANLDPSDDDVVGPPSIISDCEERLARAKVVYKPAKVPIVVRRNSTCGAHQAVQYLKGPEGISFQPRPVVTCPLALGLARFESLAQRLALKHFGQRIKSITQGGTYSCRSMARFKMASEHSYANAIDLYGFVLANGKRISVLSDFGSPKSEPKGKEGEFLRELARAAYDEGVFSVVVTRFFDELHRDHIHVDIAHYRTDGTR